MSAGERGAARQPPTSSGQLSLPDAHLRAILESALDCIVTIDASGRVVEFNPAAERTFGYARNDALGKEMAALIIPPSLRDRHRAGMARYLATGEGRYIRRRIETTAMRSDGAQFPVELTITPIEADDAPIFVAYLRDISERKQAESERRRLLDGESAARAEAERQAQQLQAVFEAMSDGVAIYDTVGRVTSVNPALRRLIGIDHHPEYEALPLDERATWLALFDSDGAPLKAEKWPPARVLRGEVLVGERTMEMVVHTLDGRRTELSVTGAPVRSADGAITGAVCLYRDVAARRIIERQSAAALDTLMRCADAVTTHTPRETPSDLLGQLATLLLDLEAADFTHAMLIDAHGHLTPIGIYGVTTDQARTWREGVEHFDPASLPQLAEVTAHLATGRPLMQHFNVDRPLISENTVHALHVRAAITGPVLVDGQVVGLLSISRTRPPEPGAAGPFAPWDVELIADVGRLAGQALKQARLGEQLTHAEAARLAAEAAARQRDEFLSIASHELKTPVTSLKLNLQLAQRRMDLKHTGADGQYSFEALVGALLPRTNDQVDRLTRLIDDLLDVSRIATDKLALRVEPADLGRIVESIVAEQRQHNPTRMIDLALPGDPIWLRVDADRIGQVVTNYLTNALKYSPDGTPVEVTIELAGKAALVSVRDFGAGLPEQEHERIWERFYRSPDIEVQSGSGIGLGLGLFISRSIIERHGGQVGVESRAGAGARFWFTLPLDTGEMTANDGEGAE